MIRPAKDRSPPKVAVHVAGFVVMGITLTLNRMGQAGKALSIGLMAAGTALVFVGLCAGGWSG